MMLTAGLSTGVCTASGLSARCAPHRFFVFLTTHLFLHITEVTCFRILAAVGRRATLANTLCFTFIVLMLMFGALIIPPGVPFFGAP